MIHFHVSSSTLVVVDFAFSLMGKSIKTYVIFVGRLVVVLN